MPFIQLGLFISPFLTFCAAALCVLRVVPVSFWVVDDSEGAYSLHNSLTIVSVAFSRLLCTQFSHTG